jgi:hypothetical protein
MKALTLVFAMVCVSAHAQNGFFATAPWMQPNNGNLIGDWNRGASYSYNGYGYQATGVQPYYRPYHYRSRVYERPVWSAEAENLDTQLRFQTYELQSIRDELQRQSYRRW